MYSFRVMVGIYRVWPPVNTKKAPSKRQSKLVIPRAGCCLVSVVNHQHSVHHVLNWTLAWQDVVLDLLVQIL